MTSRRRVVITGMGAVTPIGIGVPQFWRACRNGRSGVSRIQKFEIPAGYSDIAGQVAELQRSTSVGVERWEAADRVTRFAMAAADEAWKQANAHARGDCIARDRLAVYLCTAIAQIESMERSFVEQTNGATTRLQPPRAQDLLARDREHFSFNTTALAVAGLLGAEGPCVTIPTGCTGGLDAMGHALDAIRDGECDVCITGASEAPITPLVVAAFGKIGATSLNTREPTKASRPFDINRDGFVIGEGAGLFVLEAEEHARARNATILAEVAGFATVNNCHHMTDIPEDGVRIARAAELALQDAMVEPDEIDTINAHGSSTPQNDIAESNAYHRIFGKRARFIPVTSIKSQIGHPLSASNAIEVVASVQSILDDTIPPTINLDELDPRCRLDVVGNKAREARVRSVLKTSSGFSGIHSALVLKAVKGLEE